jgi:hypothetical protein
MISAIVDSTLYWLACAVMACYNSISIKGNTNTREWHLGQFLFIILIISANIRPRLLGIISLAVKGDWHNFGIQAVIFGLVFFVGAAIYVFFLHWLEGKYETR